MLKLSPNKLIMLLSVAGIGVSLYLTYVKLTSNPIICGIGDCSKVQNSEYASIFGIPVAVFGVGFYFVMFALAYILQTNPESPLTKNLTYAKYGWIIWGVLFSTYLTYLELFVINAICMWCVISYIIVLLIAAIVFFEWRKNAVHKL